MVPGAEHQPGEGAALPDLPAGPDRQRRLCDYVLPHTDQLRQLSLAALAQRRLHRVALQVSGLIDGTFALFAVHEGGLPTQIVNGIVFFGWMIRSAAGWQIEFGMNT